jgi:MHS family proline/betaine transporter-like MFS transporter
MYSNRVRRNIAGASIGNVMEWYDFGVYAYFAIIISKEIFPSSAASLLETFVVFGIGYVFRPLGSIVFAHYGDKIGRKNMLLITFWLMGFGTLLTGLTPNYVTIGLGAPILLALFRIMQGFGAGGEWGGVGSYLTEFGGSNKRAFYGSFQQFFILISLLAGSLTALATTGVAASFMDTIGWRLPFIIGGLVLLPIAFILRRQMDETVSFTTVKEKKETLKYPIKKVFTKDWKPTVLVIFGTLIWTVSFYIMLTYLPTYLSTTTSLTSSQTFIVTSFGISVIAAFVLIIGKLSDRLRKRKIFPIIGSLAFVVLTYPIFYLIHGAGFIEVMLLVGFLDFFIAFMSGTLVAFFAESFPTNDRYSGFIPYNLSTAYFGGFAPTIAIALITLTKNPLSPSFYVIATAVLSLIAFILMKETGNIEKLPETKSLYSKEAIEDI